MITSERPTIETLADAAEAVSDLRIKLLSGGKGGTPLADTVLCPMAQVMLSQATAMLQQAQCVLIQARLAQADELVKRHAP